MTFKEQLAVGQIGEGAIARYLQGRGWNVLPVYETEIDTGKGPRVFGPTKNLVAPDMLTFRDDAVLWIEAKRKTRFSWYGKRRQWVTGIDLRHYEDYLCVAAVSPWPVWLLFLHCEAQAWPRDVERWGAPHQCPVGLFGNELPKLQQNESHRSLKHGKSGMVYWAVDSLCKIADIDSLELGY